MNYVDVMAQNRWLPAEDLHKVPHLNWSFQDVPASFNWDDPQYIQSLEVYCAFGCFIGLVLFITFGFIQCCIGCQRCSRSTKFQFSYRMKKFDPLLTTMLFFSTIFIMITCVWWMYYGVGKLQANFNDISPLLKNVVNTLDLYNSFIDGLHNETLELHNLTRDLHIAGEVEKTVNLSALSAAIENRKIPDLSDDINDLFAYNRARELVTAAVIVTELLACGTLLIGICYNRVFVLHCSLVLITAVMLMSATLGGVYMSLAIGLSDMCVENQYLYEFMDHFQKSIDIALHRFLNCDGVNFDSDITTKLIDIVKFTITKIFTSHDYDNMLHVLHRIENDTEKLAHLSVCQTLTKDYEQILVIVCGATIPNLGKFCLITCVLLFLSWLLVNQLKPYADRVEDWQKVENILDKNVTITPDNDEQERLLNDSFATSYPPPYTSNCHYPNYGTSNVVYTDFTDEVQDRLYGGGNSLYQSLLSNPRLINPLAKR